MGVKFEMRDLDISNSDRREKLRPNKRLNRLNSVRPRKTKACAAFEWMTFYPIMLLKVWDGRIMAAVFAASVR